jgi:hypothetical protein
VSVTSRLRKKAVLNEIRDSRYAAFQNGSPLN